MPGKKAPAAWKNWKFDPPAPGQYLSPMDRVPLFPLGLVLLPRMPLPLHIFEERYRIMFDHCIREDQPFGVVLQTGSTVQSVGCLARVENVINRYDDGRLDVLTVGTERFRIHATHHDRPYLEADVEAVVDIDPGETGGRNLPELVRSAIDDLREFAHVAGYTVDTGVIDKLDYEELSFLMATTDVFSTSEKQELLEMRCTATRIDRAARALKESRERRSMVQRIREVLGTPESEDLAHLFN